MHQDSIIDFALVPLLLILSIFHTLLWFSIVEFEQCNVDGSCLENGLTESQEIEERNILIF